jgi:hypothetical protein
MIIGDGGIREVNKGRLAVSTALQFQQNKGESRTILNK